MFRKTLIAIAATAMVAGPLVGEAAAQPRRDQDHRVVVKETVRGPNGRTVVTKRVETNHRRWAKGDRFDRRHATNYRVIDNYRNYRLRQPPRGYHWVRSGNDAVLVAIGTGLIASVLAGAIR